MMDTHRLDRQLRELYEHNAPQVDEVGFANRLHAEWSRKGQRRAPRSRSRRGVLTAFASVVVLALVAAGLYIGVFWDRESTTLVTTDDSMSPGSLAGTETTNPDVTSSVVDLPPLEPVNIIQRTSAPWVWSAVIANQAVAYVESSSFATPLPGEWPGPRETAIVEILNLETGQVSAIPGSDLYSPVWEDFAIFPWWFLAGLSSAEPQTTVPSLVWAVCNNREENGVRRWQNVTGWTPDTGTKTVLDPETTTFDPIRTGDILAFPLASTGPESVQGGSAGSTLGKELLVLTPSLDEPVAVDPAAPVLPESAIEDLSPYASWSGQLLRKEPSSDYELQFRSDLPGQPPRVFDLRTGESLTISVEDPRTSDYWRASMVAGRWVAWVAVEDGSQKSSLYLADLSTGQAQRLLDGNAPESSREIALSEEWLLWTDLSGNLLGYHLPDLEPVQVTGVLAPGEYNRNLQISGDLAALMVVAPGDTTDAIGPECPPKWTAVRLVRLR